MPGIDLPAGKQAFDVRVEEEYERIAERNVRAAHVHEAVHRVVHPLPAGSDIS